MKRIFFALFATIIAAFSLHAQQQTTYTFKAIVLDSLTKQPIEHAVVAIYEGGASSVSKFAISNRSGAVEILGIRRGEHTIKFDLLGYRSRSQTISFTSRESVVDLGQVLMQEDVNMLEGAVVTAMGNPIVVKKDTITYNASAFKTSDNDMLEDLLKKFPGFEVDKEGKITVNGKEITKECKGK